MKCYFKFAFCKLTFYVSYKIILVYCLLTYVNTCLQTVRAPDMSAIITDELFWQGIIIYYKKSAW